MEADVVDAVNDLRFVVAMALEREVLLERRTVGMSLDREGIVQRRRANNYLQL